LTVTKRRALSGYLIQAGKERLNAGRVPASPSGRKYGIGRPYKLYLPETVERVVSLSEEVPLRYEIAEANYLGGESYKGTSTKLSLKTAEVRLEKPVPILSNLKMQFVGNEGQDIPGALYAKVVRTIAGEPRCPLMAHPRHGADLPRSSAVE
jgi:hypothetical protein